MKLIELIFTKNVNDIQENLSKCGELVQSQSDMFKLNINEIDNIGYTPLMYAYLEQNQEIIDILLKHGAIVNVNVKYELSFGENIESYVINLESRKDRLEKFNKQVKELNIPYQRFNAFQDSNGLITKFLNKGQNGCLASHVRIIEQSLNQKTPKHLCIFEDDAQFCDDFMLRFNYLSAVINNYDWDIIYLSAFHHLPENFRPHKNMTSPFYKNSKMNTFEFTNHHYIHKMNSSFIMVGYIINHKKIKKIFNLIMNEIPKPNSSQPEASRPIDHIMMNLMEEGNINVYSFVPGMIGQQQGFSNILNYEVSHNDYFKNSHMCGQHVFVNKLNEFDYINYFSKYMKTL